MSHTELTEALVEQGWTIRSASDCGVIAARGTERLYASRRNGGATWSCLYQYDGGGSGFNATAADELREGIDAATPAEVGA